ncbi:MAG: DUF1638 domain-containing protein [Planctomycetia bacterium]|nr:DUF1638 domain-containing protein [Planctomycetia bacterium]
MRFRLLACETLRHELEAVCHETPHEVCAEFLTHGLHDAGGAKIRETLATKIQLAQREPYDAVLLGYGLCNNGLVGLGASRIPLVVPRAHDCVTLLVGSRKRYQEYFYDHPGTFFQSVGWMEFGRDLPQQDPFQEWVEQFGEENAQYLRKTLNRTKNYTRMAFIDTMEPYGDTCEIRRSAGEIAEKNGWTMEILPGDLTLLRKLVQGVWDDDFLVVPPGKTLDGSYDDGIVKLC